jgi:hypothetical protein
VWEIGIPSSIWEVFEEALEEWWPVDQELADLGDGGLSSIFLLFCLSRGV